jgi:hypothetical protein
LWGFDILTAVVMNVAFFRDTVQCSLYVNRHFRGTYHLYLQGKKSAKQGTSVQQVARQNSPLIFEPEDGGDALLQNIGSNTDYMALYPRRWQH